MNPKFLIGLGLLSNATMGVGIECFSPLDQLSGNHATLNEFAYYEQRSASALVLAAGIESPSFFASIRADASLSASHVTLTIPSNPLRIVGPPDFFGLFHGEHADSREGLEEVTPVSGAYQLAVQTAQGSASAMLRFPASGWPQVPRFVNYNELQAADPSGDIVVRWNPLPAADDLDSYVSFQLVNQRSREFFASSTCTDSGAVGGIGDLNRRLPVSATSITLPKGFLEAGAIYQIKLLFERHLLTAKNLAGINSQGTGLSIYTTSTLTTIGGPPVVPPKIVSLIFGDGGISVLYQGTPGHEFVVQATQALSGPWVEVAHDTSGEPTGGISFPQDRFGPLVFFRVITH